MLSKILSCKITFVFLVLWVNGTVCNVYNVCCSFGKAETVYVIAFEISYTQCICTITFGEKKTKKNKKTNIVCVKKYKYIILQNNLRLSGFMG